MFKRSSSASRRKLDKIGMVVLRSTTLCVAVSSLTRSWRLTVISIAAPCTAGFSTSVSLIGICIPRPRSQMTLVEAIFRHGHTLQHIAAGRNGCLLFLLIVFILGFACAWKTGTLLWITGIARLGTTQRRDCTATERRARVVLRNKAGGVLREVEKDKRLKEKTVVPVVQ